LEVATSAVPGDPETEAGALSDRYWIKFVHAT